MLMMVRCFLAQKGYLNEKGQGLVEYGLILGLVSVLAIASLTLIGGDIKTKLEAVAAAL